MTKLQASVVLFLITIAWGLSYPLTQMLIFQGVAPNAIVMYKGVLFLAGCLIFFRKSIVTMKRREFLWGLLIGACNAIGNVLQTVSMAHTLPSNSAFLTVTNVVMVPFLTLLFFRVKPPKKSLISVPLCVVGLAILTGVIKTFGAFNIGDVYALLGALGFGLMITFLSHSDADFKVTAFGMAITQFAGGLVMMFISGDAPALGSTPGLSILILLYLGVVSTFITASLQCKAQQFVPSTSAALIMSMESVFGSLFSIVLGLEAFTITLLVGGALILLSVIIMETNFIRLPGLSRHKI